MNDKTISLLTVPHYAITCYLKLKNISNVMFVTSVSTPTDLSGNIHVGFLWQVQKVTSVDCLTG